MEKEVRGGTEGGKRREGEEESVLSKTKDSPPNQTSTYTTNKHKCIYLRT